MAMVRPQRGAGRLEGLGLRESIMSVLKNTCCRDATVSASCCSAAGLLWCLPVMGIWGAGWPYGDSIA